MCQTTWQLLYFRPPKLKKFEVAVWEAGVTRAAALEGTGFINWPSLAVHIVFTPHEAPSGPCRTGVVVNDEAAEAGVVMEAEDKEHLGVISALVPATWKSPTRIELHHLPTYAAARSRHGRR